MFGKKKKGKLTAVTGINWGDEGKGRIVDLLCARYDVVARYQGGNNAGHTVINERGKFILNLLPSGILREGTVNVMGNGMVVDIEHLAGEIKSLRAKGVSVTPDNLKISGRAVISMPFHKAQDIAEEDRLAGKKFGSTRRGIAPAYADKYMKKCLRLNDLFDSSAILAEKTKEYAEWKNLLLTRAYGTSEIKATDTLEWLKRYGAEIAPFVCDAGGYLYAAADEGKSILFEAQLGALRDVDFGIYPFTTSSNTLAAYAAVGAGCPGLKIDDTLGVMKAYSSCVGEGPFATELFGKDGDALREEGGEYGAATGRPRRVGWFDVPASRFGVRAQGADALALTKLDILSYLDEIPVCVAYDIDGKRTEEFPCGEALKRAKPVLKTLKGFKTDISGCRKKSDLPAAALDYARFIEDAAGCKIKYLSVGPEREAYIEF